MIRLYVIIAALLATIAAGGWIVMLQMENTALATENNRLTREVRVQREAAEQAKQAREVEAAYREYETARADELQRGIEALLTGDLTDADTPIDPRIGDYLECLRRNGHGNEADCTRGLGEPEDASPDQ